MISTLYSHGCNSVHDYANNYLTILVQFLFKLQDYLSHILKISHTHTIVFCSKYYLWCIQLVNLFDHCILQLHKNKPSACHGTYPQRLYILEISNYSNLTVEDYNFVLLHCSLCILQGYFHFTKECNSRLLCLLLNLLFFSYH